MTLAEARDVFSRRVVFGDPVAIAARDYLSLDAITVELGNSRWPGSCIICENIAEAIGCDLCSAALLLDLVTQHFPNDIDYIDHVRELIREAQRQQEEANETR